MVIQIVWVVCALVQMWGVDRLHGREIRFSLSNEAYFVVLMLVALFSPLLMLLDVVGFLVSIDLHLRLLLLKYQRWVAERHLKNLKSELQRKTGQPFTVTVTNTNPETKPRRAYIASKYYNIYTDRQAMTAMGKRYAAEYGGNWNLILMNPGPGGEFADGSTYEVVSDSFFTDPVSKKIAYIKLETFNAE